MNIVNLQDIKLTQKSLAFLYTNNEKTEREIKETIPFTIATKMIKYWEKAMAPHSSTLAWKIPWTEKPGGRQSMGSHRVGHGWATSLSLFTFMHWRRKWQPIPVAWRIPWMEKPGRLHSIGLHRFGHDWSDLVAATGIYLCKETKDLYIEKYKTLMKEIKEDTNRWRNIPC